MEDLESLLERTLGGELEAFGEVVARFQDMAFGYAYSMLGHSEDAQDAVQEAFIIAYSKLEDLRDRKRFPGWFRRIVLSTCRSAVRGRPPTVPLAEVEATAGPACDPAQLAERAELRRTVVSAIRSLSPSHRAATVLFYIDDYSVEEIAEFLQVSVGTVKRRLHDSRKQLKGSMMGVIEEGVRGQRLPAGFRQEVLRRIAHWERFRGSEEEKVEMVESDPDWMQLVEFEIGLEPMSPECKQIRKCIASMEPCHEHYLENVEAAIGMIADMKARHVLDCGEACEERREAARSYAEALEAWLERDAPPPKADERSREVFDLLGERTPEKAALVEHLARKLRDNAYSVYADEEEDFDLTESRIQHLEICNYNWPENLRIVLKEIAAGKRLFPWHAPDGYNAHGDCPDRTAALGEVLAAVAAWVEGRRRGAGKRGRVLGEATAEKRWLAASLCKHVASQHSKHDADQLLAMPSL